MNWRSLAVGLGTMAAVLVACEEDEEGSSNPCDAYCAKLADLECASETCEARCGEFRSNNQDCIEEVDAVLRCRMTKGSPVCGFDGAAFETPEGACDTEDNALFDCQSGSGGSSGSGGGGPAACQFESDSAACSSCVQTSCEASCAACSGNTDCALLLGCVYACEEADCMEECWKTHADGVESLETFTSCIQTHCGEVCGTGT